MSKTMTKRPDRTTMEGMIWNANHTLDMVLDPKTPGVPRGLFRDCKGLVLLSVVEAGFIFSGSVGTGVILTQNDEGKWSAPSALGLTGVGFGVLVGAEIKDILIILVDDNAVNALAGEHQIKFGSQLGIAAGPIGREMGGDLNFSYNRGDIALSYSFSKGLFLGINLEGAVVGARPKVNKKFYGKDVKPSEILFDGIVDMPENSGIDELHKKLDLLKKGKTSELTEEEVEKKEKLRSIADDAGKSAKDEHGDEIVYVDIKEEAAKEDSSKIEEGIKSEPKEGDLSATDEVKDDVDKVEDAQKAASLIAPPVPEDFYESLKVKKEEIKSEPEEEAPSMTVQAEDDSNKVEETPKFVSLIAPPAPEDELEVKEDKANAPEDELEVKEDKDDAPEDELEVKEDKVDTEVQKVEKNIESLKVDD